MLTSLTIRDLAIIASATLEFDASLWVITGETGAGKSILVSALQLVTGGRGHASLVRAGAEAAHVEAVFDLSGLAAHRAQIRQWLDLDTDELLISRSLRADGRSRAWVNGIAVPLQRLTQLTQGLIDICSQHEHHSLSDPAQHLHYLDAFAQLGPSGDAMGEAWRALQQAEQTLQTLSETLAARAEREAVIRFQLEEIDAIDPRPQEDDELTDEANRLGHAVRLAESATLAERALQADEESATDKLGHAAFALRSVRALDPSLEQLASRLDELHAAVEELGRDIGRYSRRIVHDPARLSELETRLASLKRLARRHGGTLEAVLTKRDALRSELASLSSIEAHNEQALAAREQAWKRASETARTLSQARKSAADQLGQAISTELHDLGMGDATLWVEVAPRTAAADAPELDGARLGPQGIDRAELLIAPNLGEPPRPLHRIASGGELSRALLAIKRVLAGSEDGGTYVFDEIDTGVGGAVAEAIGRKLANVAAHHQVICITHQPQIAVYGAHHLHVSKSSDGQRTTSTIAELRPEERTREIARMLGGIEVDETHLKAAQSLQRAAKDAQQAQITQS